MLRGRDGVGGGVFGGRGVVSKVVGVGSALVLLVSGCGAEIGATGETPPPPSGKSASRAREELKELRTGTAGSMSGYDRDRFGPSWKDTDDNGCDQRNDILARDLEAVRKRSDCVVLSGRLHDPYTGEDIDFTKSRAAEVQIDHIFPLALAWRMGADDWSESRREQFANDRDNLLAVWGRPNQQKSDSGPAEWRPRESYQCTYGIKFIAVATEYRLPVTRTDRSALEDFLARC